MADLADDARRVEAEDPHSALRLSSGALLHVNGIHRDGADLDEQVVRADLGLGYLDIHQAVGVIGREVPVEANRGDGVLADFHDNAPSLAKGPG